MPKVALRGEGKEENGKRDGWRILRFVYYTLSSVPRRKNDPVTAAQKTEAQKHIGTLYLLWMYITDKVGIRCHKAFYLSAGWSFSDFCSGECSDRSCLHGSSALLISHIITLCVKFAQTVWHAKRVCVYYSAACHDLYSSMEKTR